MNTSASSRRNIKAAHLDYFLSWFPKKWRLACSGCSAKTTAPFWESQQSQSPSFLPSLPASLSPSLPLSLSLLSITQFVSQSCSSSSRSMETYLSCVCWVIVHVSILNHTSLFIWSPQNDLEQLLPRQSHLISSMDLLSPTPAWYLFTNEASVI